MGVGADDPTDAVAAAAGDGIEVAGVVGAGVDDRDLVDADQVGVGAGAGHHPRVGRHDPAHQRAQGPGHAGDERRWRRDLGVRIDHFRRLATGHGFHLPVSAPDRPDRW